MTDSSDIATTDTPANPPQGPGATAVPAAGIACLLAYLIVATGCVGRLLWQEFPRCAAPAAVAATTTPAPAAAPPPAEAPNGLRVDTAQPSRIEVSGGQPMTIMGTGFTPQTRVFIDGLLVNGAKSEGSRFLMLSAPAHAAGSASITVVDGGSVATLQGAVTYVCPAVADTTLVVLVLLAGALGGLVHAMRSLFWYVGHRRLVWSWTPMYLLLPFTGASLAFVFFLIVRAGLYQPTGEASLVLVGLAALVGMFSTQAAEKLKDVAEGVFTKVKPGANSVPPSRVPGTPPAKALTPDSGPIAGGTEVTIAGSPVTAQTTVQFDNVAASRIRVIDAKTLVATTPPHAAGKVDVAVATPGHTAVLHRESFTYTS